MICAVDTETYTFDKDSRTYKPILDTHHFLRGCYIDPYETKVFKTKQEMQEFIIAKATKMRHKENLYIYAHNHQYDFLAYADILKWEIELFSLDPFIAETHICQHTGIFQTKTAKDEFGNIMRDINGEPITYQAEKLTKGGGIYFLDMYAFAKGPLAEAAENMGMKKGETPEDVPEMMIDELVTPYLINDTQIVYNYMVNVVRLCKKYGITSKKYFTFGQIAINHLLKTLPGEKGSEYLLDPYNRMYKPSYTANNIILNAIKLGRVEAYTTGLFDNVTYIDMNSMFSWAAKQMLIPNLLTEMTYKTTENITIPNSILEKHGVSQAIVTITQPHKIGYLGVRNPDGEQVFPTKEGTVMAGTWSHLELSYAQTIGYRVDKIMQSVTYETLDCNPLSNMIDYIYGKRMEAEGLEKYFLKQLLNNCWGKLSQHRKRAKYVIDDMEEKQQYTLLGYNEVERFGYTSIFKKEEETPYLRHYAPILYVYITATARHKHYLDMMEIGPEHVLYCDTDSIIFYENPQKNMSFEMQHIYSRTTLLKYGNALGEYKTVETGTKAIIYGKKAYATLNKNALAGVNKKNRTFDKFISGNIETQRMTGLAKSFNPENTGRFETVNINLADIEQSHTKKQEELRNTKLYIDNEDIQRDPGLVEQVSQWLSQTSLQH